MTNRIDNDDEILEDEFPPTFSVLIRERQDWSFADVSAVLRMQGGLSMADAARVAKKHAGILVPSVDRATAKETVLALRELDVHCFLVPDHNLFPPPEPSKVETCVFNEAGIRALHSSATGVTTDHAWPELRYIAAAHISSASPGGHIRTQTRHKGAGITTRKQVMAFAPEFKKGEFSVLHLYSGFERADAPGKQALLAIDSTTFDFACLGEEQPANRFDKIGELTRLIARHASAASLSDGTREMVDSGGRITASFPTVPEFLNECHWQINLLELERRKKAKESSE